MSESVFPKSDEPHESHDSAGPVELPRSHGASAALGPADPGGASAPISSAHPVLPPDAQALLDAIARGLAPDADDATRAMTGEICARLAQLAGTPTAAPAAVPPVTPPVASSLAFAPVLPTIPPPASPLAAAARALRQMPPEQLLDLLLQRLRTALPAGAAVATPTGIQFALVPVAPVAGAKR